MPGDVMKAELPIGVDDFATVRENGLYFVDKSELISDILKNPTGVYLFTRPRRFGKSLNLSMLDAFFNIRYRENTWFDGLKINDHPEVGIYKNTRPVIFLSMKDLDFLSVEQFVSDFSQKLKNLYEEYVYLANSDKLIPSQLADYQSVLSGTANLSLLKDSLNRLCLMLELHHGVKPIILLDEYDDTLNHAYGKESYDAILSTLRGFYSVTFKSNKHLAFGVVTGVMQIAKEGIFSGLNNLKVNNIFEAKFDEKYGFTESEVKEICRYYGHSENFEEAK